MNSKTNSANRNFQPRLNMVKCSFVGYNKKQISMDKEHEKIHFSTAVISEQNIYMCMGSYTFLT